MRLKYALLLIFLISLYPIPSIAGANTATIKARCYSIVLGYADAGTMLAFFTTYDGLTGMPLTEYFEGYYYISEEASPVTLGGTQYRTDYIITTSVNPYEYGSVTFTIPNTDLNDNGFPDIGEIENSASSIHITGSAMADYNDDGYATTATVSSYLSRPANTISGTYYGSWTNSLSSRYDFTGIWSLISGQGSMNYTGNTIDLSLTITNYAGAEAYTGTTTYTIDSDDQITINGFEMESALGDNITVYSAILYRDGEYYRGNFQVYDGNNFTSWRDYYNWQLEIQDDNDWDEDGIPDLTDPKPFTPKDMSWLPVLLDDEN